MPVVSNPKCHDWFPFCCFWNSTLSHTETHIFTLFSHPSTHTLYNRRYCTVRRRKCQAKLWILTTGILSEMGHFVQRQVTKEWSPLRISRDKRSLVWEFCVWEQVTSVTKKCRPGDWEKQAVPGCLKTVFCGRSAMGSLDSEVKEERLREDLKFYFMSPCEKYRARRQIPWKLGLQILKIVMVTTQVTHTMTPPFPEIQPSPPVLSLLVYLQDSRWSSWDWN